VFRFHVAGKLFKRAVATGADARSDAPAQRTSRTLDLEAGAMLCLSGTFGGSRVLGLLRGFPNLFVEFLTQAGHLRFFKALAMPSRAEECFAVPASALDETLRYAKMHAALGAIHEFKGCLKCELSIHERTLQIRAPKRPS